jgi:hypothetical protein
MVDIKHAEGIDPGVTAFDQVIQDIREIRANQESRSLLHRRARSADQDVAPEESLPLFLSTSEDQDWQPGDQDSDLPQQRAWQPSVRPQSTRQQGARPQSNWRQSSPPLQDARYRDTDYQDTQYEDTEYPDAWLHDALESDRDRVKAVVAPTALKRVVKTGVLTTTVVAALAVLFALEDGRNLVSHASASLAAVLPAFSAGIGRPAPAMATPQIAEASRTPVAIVAPPVAAVAAPAATVAAAPTREAIVTAYQTALQSQPEIRQPPVAPPAPAPAPAVRRLDPDELATLLKRAQSLLDMGDLPGARLLLARAADAHEAKAAFILAQTYDPAVLGTQDSRSITPDPEAARLWYQKAAQFGSQEAQLRLAQMQN